MKTIRFRSFAIVAFSCLLCVAGGGALGALLLAPPVPESLKAAPTLISVPVESRVIDDSRNIPLAFITGKTTSLTAPLSGKVTALDISTGGTLNSGEEIARIDGQPLIALSTSTPLYRPLADGVKGDDITALQEELSRLGYIVTVSGVVDWNTRWAIADLLGIEDGAGAVPSEIPTSSVVWIPAPSVTVASCDIGLGQSLDPSAPILTVTDSSERAVLTLPDEAIAGDRVLTLSTGSLPVPADGVITDPATLGAIKESDQYKGFTAAFKDNANEGVFNVPWTLATPINALVVPPSSLFGIVGDKACVAQDGQVYAATIVGSQLGQSYIVVDAPLNSVDLDVKALSCR